MILSNNEQYEHALFAALGMVKKQLSVKEQETSNVLWKAIDLYEEKIFNVSAKLASLTYPLVIE